YDAGLARRMIPVESPEEPIAVSGFISPPELTRANRAELTFFVNGRWVQDSALAAAAVQAYHGMLMVGRYPLVVLFVEMPSELVDVNVHPTKAEVRFAQRDRVFTTVQRAVRRALLAHAPVPQLEPLQPGLAWRPMPAPPEPMPEPESELAAPPEVEDGEQPEAA